MTDIVRRLRYLSAPRFSSIPVAEVIAEAADEIEYLQEQIDILNDKVEACREFMRKL